MNRLRSIQVEQQLPQRQPATLTGNNLEVEGETFGNNGTLDDHQAHIRRRAPTRHSIKSLTGRRTPSKQNSSTEVISNLILSKRRLILLPFDMRIRPFDVCLISRTIP